MSLCGRVQLPVVGFLILLTTLIIPPAAAGGRGWPAPGLNITANKSVFSPEETMQIGVSINTSKMSDTLADLYLAVQEPDSQITFHLKKSQWTVAPWPSREVVSLPLKNSAIGPYQWFFVLCQPGTDPLDEANWLAYSSLQLTLLPSDTPVKSPTVTAPPHGARPLLIAHAGGVINGRWGTNARQALDANYQKGIRYFEMDFSWTSDGHLVSIHDWGLSFKTLFEQAKQQPSHQAYLALSMTDNLTQMTIDSVLEWLSTHRDATIVTDIKESNLAGLKLIASKARQLQQQFIPQIYQLNEFDQVKKMGFERIIFSLYKTRLTDSELLKFSTSNPLFAVTMPIHRAFASPIARLLTEAGVTTYAHTINQPEVFNYLRDQAVYGIYTDQIHSEETTVKAPHRK